jgi:DNA-binding IclR family transcriptional regulator
MAGETLKTIDRTLQVLSAFSRARPELTVAELVEMLGFPRAVVTRIVTTLEKAQFLERTAGSFRYRIGIAACELGATYLAGNALTDASRDILRELAQRTGFTVYLGARQSGDVVILGSHEGRTQVRFIWAVGDRLPIATTALGKAMLLHMSPEEIDRLLGTDMLPGLTTGSITKRQVLDEQLAEYSGKGWIPAFEESLPDVYAVGAALLDGEQKPLAGISISFLRYPDDPDQVERMGNAVLEAARAISRRIAPHYAYQAERKVHSLSSSYASG